MKQIDENHPWYPATIDFEHNVLPFLQARGKQIGAQKGHCAADKIIDYYTMLHRSFDPVTLELLKQSIEEWKHEQNH